MLIYCYSCYKFLYVFMYIEKKIENKQKKNKA